MYITITRTTYFYLFVAFCEIHLELLSRTAIVIASPTKDQTDNLRTSSFYLYFEIIGLPTRPACSRRSHSLLTFILRNESFQKLRNF